MSKLHKIVVLSAMLGFALTASAAMNNGKGTPAPNKPVATQSNKAVAGKMRKADPKAVKNEKMKRHMQKHRKMNRARKAK